MELPPTHISPARQHPPPVMAVSPALQPLLIPGSEANERLQDEETERNGLIDPISTIDLPSLPPLSQAIFLADGFEPSTFLESRKFVELGELRAELRSYLATLRTSLVELINTDYESFISLSLHLRQASVPSSLSIILKPVLSIRTAVSDVRDELEEMRKEMEEVLEDRKLVRERKAVLRRLLEVEDGVGKVEGLLMLGEGSKKTSKPIGYELDQSMASPAKRLERIAGEYNQMLYLVKKAGVEWPFVKSLDPRISRITSTLHLDLSQLLTSLLLSPPTTASSADVRSHRDSLTSVLRTYASLSLIHVAEDVFRRTIVKPFVNRTIHRDVLSAGTALSPTMPSTPFQTFGTFSQMQEQDPLDPTSPLLPLSGATILDRAIPLAYVIEPVNLPASPGGRETEFDDPLRDLLNKILAFVSKECGLVLDVAERSLASSATALVVEKVGVGADGGEARIGYEMLTNVVWDAIGTRLMNELGSTIFAAGRTTVFHHNYTLISSFISKLEALCPTLPHLQYFRSHASFQAFTKRFQLPVYFQLRFKEIATKVERSLDSSTGFLATSGGAGSVVGKTGFVLSESETVWKAIQDCWSNEVFLKELAGKFWRLTLQLISRYRMWLNLALPSNASLLPGSANSGARSSFDAARPSTSTPTSTRPSTPAIPDEQAEGNLLRNTAVLIADSRMMEKKVYEFYQSSIKPSLLSDEADESSTDDLIQTSLKCLSTPLTSTLSNQIVLILSKRSTEPLKFVKQVASQVRATSGKKGAKQNEASHFVSSILRELKAFVEVGSGKLVEEGIRKEWCERVLDDVVTKYASILASQKKTEDGLRWLKKGKGISSLSFFGRSTPTPATEAGGEEEESKRVNHQMWIDVRALCADARTLGVELEGREAFKALKNLTGDGSAVAVSEAVV